MDWIEAVDAFNSTGDLSMQKRLVDLLHQEMNRGRIQDPAFLVGLDALYRDTRDVALSTELKRLQNRYRLRQVMGSDLLRLKAPPIGDREQQKLWEDLHALKSAYDSSETSRTGFEEKYTVHEMVGEGGMSRVFRATRESDGQTVAVKYLRKKFFKSPTIVARFQRECRLCLMFDHPNIVKVFEADLSDGIGFIVMEYVPHGGLDGFLNDPDLSPRLALAAAGQAARAVAYLHAQKVIHRDIKLANLLVSYWAPDSDSPAGEKIHVKLTDFGLSKTVPGDGLTKVGTKMGTEFYSSPEMLANPLLADERTDIYSLGVAFYRLISGDGFPVGDYQTLHELAPELPVELDILLKACLEKDKERRFASAKDLSLELEGFEAAL